MKTRHHVMLLALTSGLIVFSLRASVVVAQAPASADAQKIAACLKAADEKRSSGGQCIGVVADPCLDGANGSTEGEKACASRELAVWMDLLRRAMGKVKAGGFKEIEANVAEAQKSWAASRDKLCAEFDKIDPGMAPGGSTYCRLQETARRTLMLQKLGAALNPH